MRLTDEAQIHQSIKTLHIFHIFYQKSMELSMKSHYIDFCTEFVVMTLNDIIVISKSVIFKKNELNPIF